MNLHELVADIKKEQKMSMDELLMTLTTAVTEEKEECELFKKLYKKAYGSTLSDSMCKAWVESIYGESPKWTISQTTDLCERLGVTSNTMTKYEFWACTNAFYSDFYKLAKKYELENDPEFFGELVKEYFEDEDAHDKTPANYYFTFVI